VVVTKRSAPPWIFPPYVLKPDFVDNGRGPLFCPGHAETVGEGHGGYREDVQYYGTGAEI
jgi:hypothetical protein